MTIRKFLKNIRKDFRYCKIKYKNKGGRKYLTFIYPPVENCRPALKDMDKDGWMYKSMAQDVSSWRFGTANKYLKKKFKNAGVLMRSIEKTTFRLNPEFDSFPNHIKKWDRKIS